jgi:Sec-independent protein secretion pathway component TatC
MFEHLTQSFVPKSENGSPEFKVVYLTSIILSLFGVVFLYFIKDPLFYYLYGFSPELIGSAESEAWTAHEVTLQARLISSYFFMADTVICLFLSFAALYKRIYLKYHLTQIGLVTSLLLSLLYWFAWMMSHLGRTF